MKKEAIAVLLGYLKNQQELICTMVEGIKVLDTATEESTIHLGRPLHNIHNVIASEAKQSNNMLIISEIATSRAPSHCSGL